MQIQSTEIKFNEYILILMMMLIERDTWLNHDLMWLWKQLERLTLSMMSKWMKDQVVLSTCNECDIVEVET